MTKYFLFVRKKNYQQKKQVIDEVNKTKSLLRNHAQKSQNQLEKSQRNSAREWYWRKDLEAEKNELVTQNANLQAQLIDLEATAQNYYNYAEQEIKNSNNNSVEREREQKPKTLKIDLTSSTSTTSWLNTPTPKNGKKFSFHSKESTEETIAEENPEDFISDLSSTELDDFEEAWNGLETKNNKGKQKQTKPVESTARKQESLNRLLVDYNKKIANLQNELDELKEENNPYWKGYSTALDEALKAIREDKARIQAELDYQKNFTQDQEKKYLEEIRIKDEAVRLAQKQLDDLKAQIVHHQNKNLRKNNSEQKSDLSSYEGQFDEESSDETIVFKPKTSSQSSQVKGKDKEAQSIWEEEVEQFEKETLNSWGKNSLTQPQSSKSYSWLNNSNLNSTLQTSLQQVQQLETFSEIEKFKERFSLETKYKIRRTEVENNLIFSINCELDRKEKQFNQILTEIEEKCLFELSVDIRSLDDFCQNLQTTKFSEIPELWNQAYRKILTNRLESRKQKVKSLIAQLRQISEASAEVTAGLVEKPVSPKRPIFQSTNNSKLYDLEGQETFAKGYRKRLQKTINNQVKKTKNYLGESYRNHPRTCHAIGLTALGAGTVYYNWETLTEYLNPQQIQGTLTSLSNYGNQTIATVNSTALTYWGTLNSVVNQKWTNLTALGLGLQMPSFYEQIFGNQLGVSYNEALTNLTVDDNQNSLEPIDNQSLTIQSQKLNELEQNLLNLGVPTNEICNISDRKILFKYHPDKALINRLSEAKANEIFQNLSVYCSQLENFTDDGALNLLENSTNHQPDNLLNESQINFSPKGNQTETQQNSIPLNPNNLIKISLGGATLIVSQEAARKLWAKYREKQQERESQTREKAAVKIQSIARMHQAKQEKERLAREVAERARQNEYVPNYNFSPNPTENPNQTETSQNQPNSWTNNDFANSPSDNSETATSASSAPGGGGYSGGGTIGIEGFNSSVSQFPNQIVQDILNQAQKAIESQQIPLLEVAEKRITSLFSEPDANKYYQYQPQLENKLQKVIQTKTIQEIQVNHLDIAKQIKEVIKPQKIQNKEWNEVINQLAIEKIPSVKKQIQSDILQQTKQAATEDLESDLKLAQLIKWDIQPETNWKLIIKNATQEKDIKQKWEESKKNLLTQSQEEVINNLNSLLGSELKIEDLDKPFSEFPQEVYQKKLTALKAYQQQVASHIAEKKRNYSQMVQLNTIAQPESKWKNLILPLTIGGVGVVAGTLALKRWLNSPKIVNKSSPPSSHSSTKIKLLIERYLTNLKKLQKNGYNAELAQTIQKDFQQIQVLMEEWLGEEKNKFERNNWQNFQRRYREYSEDE